MSSHIRPAWLRETTTQHPLLSEEKTTSTVFALTLWPESGLDCLICAVFARQLHAPEVQTEGEQGSF